MAEGTIGSVIDSLIIGDNCNAKPQAFHIAGDVYGIAYDDFVSGKISTFSVDSAGAISDTKIDTAEFDAVQGALPVVLHISGTVYAIAYCGAGNDGWLKTINISDAGAIGSVIASYEFDAVKGYPASLIHISGTTYALTYSDTDSDGQLKTIVIADDGTIGGTIASLEFDTVMGMYAHILHVTGNIYVIAYSGPDSDGWAKTVTISAAGAISSTGYSLEFDATSTVNFLSLIEVVSGIFAVFYRSVSAGKIVTFSVNASGVLASIDTSTFSASAYAAEACKVSGTAYAVAYENQPTDTKGKLQTRTIADDGTIGAQIDTLEFDASYACFNYILHASNSIYLIAYQYVSAGALKVISVDITTVVAPTVTTQAVAEIIGNRAAGHGNITNLGGANATAHGHCWAKTINPTTSDNKTDNGVASATGAFSSVLTELEGKILYYVRAYATNPEGTSYGANVTFTSASLAGYIWMEDSNFRGFDANAIERKYIHTDDVDDVPVDGATVDPISSNWAFDHTAKKAANATLGHVIVETGSDIDIDADGKLTLGGHKTRHQDGGNDEISIAGLSGIPTIIDKVVCFGDAIVCHNNNMVTN